MFAGKVSTKQNEYATKDPVSRLWEQINFICLQKFIPPITHKMNEA